MTLDHENHRVFLLELIQQVNIPGKHVEEAAEIIKAIRSANVEDHRPDHLVVDHDC